MVKGLDIFREWFAAYADQYVLIGGTAATLTMEDAGLEFRATKDLDIVLHVEALTPAFGEAFWKFVDAGKYEIRQASETGKPNFYRFIKPGDERFPVMVELFARAPDGLKPAEGTLGNDMSERAFQKSDGAFWRSKNMDTFKPMEPFVVSGIDPMAQTIGVRVNGKTATEYKTSLRECVSGAVRHPQQLERVAEI